MAGLFLLLIDLTSIGAPATNSFGAPFSLTLKALTEREQNDDIYSIHIDLL